MKFYRRNLPHYLPNDSPYFITFRLADSLPKIALEARRQKVDANKPKLTFRELDRHLDAATSGPKWLRQPQIATIIQEALHFRDGEDYDLFAYTIMPNHVHMVISLNPNLLLFEVLQSLKRFTARSCNQALGGTGPFWQHESYDHVIRDGELGKIIFYVLRNPVKAGFCSKFADWPYSYVNPEFYGFDESEHLQRLDAYNR
jgi:putative transposase